MRSPKKKICHRDRNYMIYVLTFLIALTGMLGISKGSPVQAAEEESTQKGSISLVCPDYPLRGWSCLCTVWQSMRSRAVSH